MYLLRNLGGWLSYCKEIQRQIVVVPPSENSEARIADNLIIPPWFTAVFGTRKFIFVPRWARYFDTRILDECLPPVEAVLQPYKTGMNPRRKLNNVLTSVFTSDIIRTSHKGGVQDDTEKKDAIVQTEQ